MTAPCSSAVIARLLVLRILGHARFARMATGANRDRRLSCEVGEDNVRHSCRWCERLRGGRLRWSERAVYCGSDRTPCYGIRGRIAAAWWEFHASPFPPSLLAKFAAPFWGRVPRGRRER